jgi:hypothetical protein
VLVPMALMSRLEHRSCPTGKEARTPLLLCDDLDFGATLAFEPAQFSRHCSVIVDDRHRAVLVLPRCAGTGTKRAKWGRGIPWDTYHSAARLTLSSNPLITCSIELSVTQAVLKSLICGSMP